MAGLVIKKKGNTDNGKRRSKDDLIARQAPAARLASNDVEDEMEMVVPQAEVREIRKAENVGFTTQENFDIADAEELSKT